MKALALAVALTCVGTGNPASNEANRLASKGKYPEITTATIIEHNTKKYLCGTAHHSGESLVIRYVIAMEVDWQIWEPNFEDAAWTAWNETYYEICGDF
jgi:hypothetical protein